MSDIIPVTGAAPTVKVCAVCRQSKSIAEFSLDRGRPRAKCRHCAADQQRARTLADPEGKRARDRAYYQRHAEDIKAYQRAYRSTHRPTLRAYFAGYRKRNPDVVASASRRWNSDNAEKRRAHSALQRAIRAGLIEQRTACDQCSRTLRVEAHHHDYAQPLNVTWLCKKCHAAADRTRRAAEVA